MGWLVKLRGCCSLPSMRKRKKHSMIRRSEFEFADFFSLGPRLLFALQGSQPEENTMGVC